MSKQHIITGVLLVLLIGAGFAVYQFFLRGRLEEYEQRARELDQLRSEVRQLEQTFGGQQPGSVVRDWEEAVPQWRQAIGQRGSFFDMSEAVEIEEIPEEEEALVRFYYEEQYDDMIDDLRTYLYNQGVRQWPQDLSFGAVRPRAYQGRSLAISEAHEQLRRLSFGDTITRMLVDSGSPFIMNVVIWPPRTDYQYLEMRTVGLHFAMRMDDLVDFVQELEEAPQYYNINAMKVSNRRLLGGGASPFLEVQMLLTMASFKEDEALTGRPAGGPGLETPGPGGPPGFPGMPGMPGGQFNLANLPGMGQQMGPAGGRQQEQSESWWEKLWPF